MLEFIYSLSFLIATSLILVFVLKKYDYNSAQLEKKDLNVDDIIKIVRDEIAEILIPKKRDISISETEYKREIRTRNEISNALKKCITGSDNDKQYVKDIIYEVVSKDKKIQANLDEVIPLSSRTKLTPTDKFDILLYVYKKNFGKKALSVIIKKYKLDRERNDKGENSYRINKEDIDKIYQLEDPYLTKSDKLMLVSQRIYQKYKGYSVIDEIRDMDIDGVSGGVSGISEVDIMEEYGNIDSFKKLKRNYESVWIFFEGKSIHLEFLSFYSITNLKRICQNIYRFGESGMLNSDVGYKVSQMKDGSRVVVVRPEFSESWAFFVRKFSTKTLNLDELIVDDNSSLAKSMIRFLAKGARITAITGSQGSGKTTLLMSMISHIYNTLNIRVQEMSFELHLRRLYPNRNILSFKETNYISGQEGLDLQKKTDGQVNILGEVASDEIAAWMIQMAQVASLFTIFTHHAKTTDDLVLSLRNSLLKCGVFRSEDIAEEQVVKVLNFDIHLKKDYQGKRYIERISEIIPRVKKLELNLEFDKSDEISRHKFYENISKYISFISDKDKYEIRDIICFENNRYVVKNPISKKQIDEMSSHMQEKDRRDFSKYLEANWGA